MPETWYRLPIFYFSNASEIRGPGDPIWAPAASVELDYELAVAAVIDTPAIDLVAERAKDVIGGFTIFDGLSVSNEEAPSRTRLPVGPCSGLSGGQRACHTRR